MAHVSTPNAKYYMHIIHMCILHHIAIDVFLDLDSDGSLVKETSWG